MALLPSIASHPSHIADCFTKPLSLSRHRFTTTTVIGDLHPPTSTTSVTTATVDSSATVASAPTPAASESVPTAPSVPLVLDTGTSRPVPRSRSDFALEITQAPYGLIRSAASVAYSSSSKSSSKSTLSNDPYTLITGEDTTVDLSSPDTTSDLEPSFTKVTFDIRDFGTATLTFIYSRSTSELLRVLLEPTQVDWLHWVPLPRLTPTESYFHIFGRDYLQAFALFHLIPIWIALVSALLRSD